MMKLVRDPAERSFSSSTIIPRRRANSKLRPVDNFVDWLLTDGRADPELALRLVGPAGFIVSFQRCPPTHGMKTPREKSAPGELVLAPGLCLCLCPGACPPGSALPRGAPRLGGGVLGCAPPSALALALGLRALRPGLFRPGPPTPGAPGFAFSPPFVVTLLWWCGGGRGSVSSPSGPCGPYASAPGPRPPPFATVGIRPAAAGTGAVCPGEFKAVELLAPSGLVRDGAGAGLASPARPRSWCCVCQRTMLLRLSFEQQGSWSDTRYCPLRGKAGRCAARTFVRISASKVNAPDAFRVHFCILLTRFCLLP